MCSPAMTPPRKKSPLSSSVRRLGADADRDDGKEKVSARAVCTQHINVASHSANINREIPQVKICPFRKPPLTAGLKTCGPNTYMLLIHLLQNKGRLQRTENAILGYTTASAVLQGRDTEPIILDSCIPVWRRSHRAAQQAGCWQALGRAREPLQAPRPLPPSHPCP